MYTRIPKLQPILQQLREQQQYRSLEPFSSAGGTLGEQTLSFCANDYLNLAQHTELKEAAIYATRHYGCSAASSRLLSGHLEIHQELEKRLAHWSGCYEAALSFGSGYLANCGILQAVLEPNATVLFDRLNHASLVDGLRLASGFSQPPIQWQRYKHCDVADLERRLQKRDHQNPVWLVTDSVFSMDGDIAPLRQFAWLSHKYQFRWIVDEAHAVGIYGHNGAGLVQGLASQLAREKEPYRLPDFVTANFSKALGSYGGYCLCSTEWKDYLVNFCRSLIYSTGLPPASAAAALVATQIVERECQGTTTTEEAPYAAPWTRNTDFAISQGLGHKLLQHSYLFHQALEQVLPTNSLRPLQSSIIPVILGSNQTAMEAADKLRHSGVLVKAIRSPTVPAGKARLRFSLSLAHNRIRLLCCAEAIGRTLQTMNLPKEMLFHE